MGCGGGKRSGEGGGSRGGGGGEKRSGEGAVSAPPAPATRGREEKGEEKRKEGTAADCSVGLKTSC